MQSVVSVFRDDPRIYDSITYLVCGSLVLFWLIATLRSAYSTARAWLAIAAIVPLTLLITYHRPYDAKLLLLTVPACAMLWAEGGLIGWVSVLITSAGVISTADIPMAILSILTSDLHLSTLSLSGKIATVLTGRPIPLILSLTGVFYLWTYIRHTPDRDRTTNASHPDQNRHASPSVRSGSNELHSPAREHSAMELGAVLGAK